MKPMLKALYDEGRRDRMREGIAKGDLSKILRRKGPGALRNDDVIEIEDRDLIIVEDGPTRETALPQPPPAQAAGPGYLDRDAHCESGVIALDGHHRPNAVDQALFDAVHEGDLAAMKAAIALGADIHSKQMYVPRHRMGDCIVSGRMSPLEYAIKKGNAGIAAELRRCGARD
jgi:hypothetical protein